jgi:AbrB family looped-hinge helix DNA binding protein
VKTKIINERKDNIAKIGQAGFPCDLFECSDGIEVCAEPELSDDNSTRLNGIDNWFLPFHNAIVAAKLTLDKAGRVVLPKPLRDRLQLAPGDTLHLEAEGDRITLRPVRQNVVLKKELGVWVYQGEPTDASIPDLIERDRENRNRSVTESDIE